MIELVWGAKFSAPVQTDPGAHPASYIMGTGSFPGVERPGSGADHPPLPSAEVKKRVQLLWAVVASYRVNCELKICRIQTPHPHKLETVISNT